MQTYEKLNPVHAFSCEFDIFQNNFSVEKQKGNTKDVWQGSQYNSDINFFFFRLPAQVWQLYFITSFLQVLPGCWQRGFTFTLLSSKCLMMVRPNYGIILWVHGLLQWLLL